MIKFIVLCIGLAGMFFLFNAHAPSAWTTGPDFANYKGLQVPWAVFAMAGFAGLVILKLKSS